MQNVLEKELLMTRRAFNYNSKEGSEEEESSLVAAALEFEVETGFDYL